MILVRESVWTARERPLAASNKKYLNEEKDLQKIKRKRKTMTKTKT